MDTETTTTTSPAETPAACPACGCGGNVLFTVELSYAGDFRPDYYGVTPEQGDTITRCDNCGGFFVHADDGSHLGAAPAPAPAEPSVSEPSETVDLEHELADRDAHIAALEAQLAAATQPAPPASTTPPADTTATTVAPATSDTSAASTSDASTPAGSDASSASTTTAPTSWADPSPPSTT